MSVNSYEYGLSFLFENRDPARSDFHKKQTLCWNNGYAQALQSGHGLDQEPPLSQHLLQRQRQSITFQTPRRSTIRHFIPAYVAYDKKVLRFYAYFRQEVLFSPEECWRVRPVIIYYFLEDDSICVMEPEVANSGILQGKLVKRHKVPKNQRGDTYHWKDLNLAMDLCVYGTKYRITHCDVFTKEFMESQGIILNDPEPTPSDPYTLRRYKPPPTFVTPSDYDSLKQFLTMDRKVLRFYGLWDDTDTLYGQKIAVVILYYLVDDTVEIREVPEPNNGRGSFPLILRKQRIPKLFKSTCQPFASCILEVSQQEVDEYYSPKDFRVGEEVELLGKRFLLCDCDEFTQKYYEKCHPEIQLMSLPMKEKPQPDYKKVIPPFNGFGSLEDSLQNCLSLIPQPPKKDLMKQLENDHKVLRYEARLDSPNDDGRRFILSYFLSNDTISIFETPTHNSGFRGGKFLRKTRVPKPGSSMDNPQYYTPADLAIGATVEVFKHCFVLTNADEYVLSYLESVTEKEQIPEQTLSSLRQALGQSKAMDPNQMIYLALAKEKTSEDFNNLTNADLTLERL